MCDEPFPSLGYPVSTCPVIQSSCKVGFPCKHRVRDELAERIYKTELPSCSPANCIVGVVGVGNENCLIV